MAKCSHILIWVFIVLNLLDKINDVTASSGRSVAVEEVNIGDKFDVSIDEALTAARLSSRPDYLRAAEPLYRQYKLSRGSLNVWPVSRDCLLDILAYRKANVNPFKSRHTEMVFEAQGSADLMTGDYTKCGKFTSIPSSYRLVEPVNPPKRIGFKSKYCTAIYTLKEPIGLCVPDSCTVAHITKLLEQGFTVSKGILHKVLCGKQLLLEKDDKFYLTKTIFLCIAAVSILATLWTHIPYIRSELSDLLLCILSSITAFTCLYRRLFTWLCGNCCGLNKYSVSSGAVSGDKTVLFIGKHVSTEAMTAEQKAGEPEIKKKSLVQCFCLSENLCTLMNCDVTKGSFTCIPAIRVLSMSLVIFYHSYFYTPFKRLANSAPWYDFISNDIGIFVSKTNISVEAFFVVSAMLAIIQCVSLSKKRTSSIVIYVIKCYIKRLWRLAPVYYTVVLIQTYIVPYIQPNPNKGPSQLLQCQKALYSHLTFTYNLNIAWSGFNPIHCIPQAWYICADLQMFLIVPWLALFYKRHECKAIIISCLLPLLVFTGNIALTAYKYSYNWNATWILYCLPQHINSYVIGIILGLCYTKTNFQFTLSKVGKYSLMISVLICMYIIHLEGRERVETTYTTWWNLLFLSNWRVCYAFIVAVLIFWCCRIQNNNVISSLLSSPCWLPLSRLSYIMFLVSCMLQKYRAEVSSYKIVWDGPLELLYHTCAVILMCLPIAIVLWLLVEKPCDNIAKYITNYNSQKAT